MTAVNIYQGFLKMLFLTLIMLLVSCSPYPAAVTQSPTIATPNAMDALLATPAHLPESRDFISPENADELTPFLLWEASITAVSWLPGMNSLGISTISDSGEYGVYVLDVDELLFTQYIQDASGAIVFSPDGNLMVSEDGVINLWEINTGEKIRSYGGNAERWVAFHSATSILLVQSFPPAFEKSRIGLWNIKNGEHTDILEINGIARNVSYSRSLSFLVLSIIEKPDNYKVVVWDINLQKQICDIPDALSAEFDEANDLLVVTDGKEFSFWDARKCEIKRKIKTEFVPPYRFAINPDGNLLAFDNGNGGISIVNAMNGIRVAELKTPRFNTNIIKFNAGGNLLLTLSNDDLTTTQTLALWQVNHPLLDLIRVPLEIPMLSTPLSPKDTP